MVSIFVPREIAEDETRVAAVPATVKRYVTDGFTVLVEKDAGVSSFIADQAFESEGARIVGSASEGYSEADLVLMVSVPTPEQIGQMKQGATLISFVYPVTSPDVVKALADKKINAYAMDAVPRISRA